MVVLFNEGITMSITRQFNDNLIYANLMNVLEDI